MRRLTRIGGVALVAAATLATAAPAAPGPRGDVYAYLTTLGLVVRAGNQQIGQADGFFEDATLRWTNNGRFAMAVSRIPGDHETGTIVAVDATTGRTVSIRCECWDVLPIGADAAVMKVTGWGRLETLHDLAAPSPTWHEIPQPGKIPDDLWRWDLAGSENGRAYLTVTPPRGDPGLFVTDGSTEPVPIGVIDGERLKLAAPAAGAAGQHLALISRATSCNTQDRVLFPLLEQRKIGVSRFGEPRLEAEHRLRVQDSWWGTDGRLYATAAAWACAGDEATQQVIPPTVWRFEDQRWQPTDDTGILSARDLPSGDQLVIRADRRLVRRDASASVPVADDVAQIAVRP
ncbi:hypothetical protein AB0B10_24940 [Micromonospora arborensis]|uniref:hypothetical protein n=1 Tax=Micromonospora arborensis TaxID=2116518 RepID=UPI0033E45B87